MPLPMFGPDPVTSATLPSSERSISSVLVHQHTADVLPVEHVLVSLVDLVQPVAPGDQLVELEVTRPVEPQEPGDVVQRVGAAEQGTLDPLLPPRQRAARVVDRVVAVL